MALDIDGTLTRIDEIHERRDFVARPLWKGLLEGTHSLPMVREMAKQLSIIPLHNHNYHGRLYIICPDPAWRARIAEVVYEEGTGRLFSNGIAHNELYFRFGEGVGVGRDERGHDVRDVRVRADAAARRERRARKRRSPPSRSWPRARPRWPSGCRGRSSRTPSRRIAR